MSATKRFKNEPQAIYRLRCKEEKQREKIKLRGRLFWPASSGPLVYAEHIGKKI